MVVNKSELAGHPTTHELRAHEWAAGQVPVAFVSDVTATMRVTTSEGVFAPPTGLAISELSFVHISGCKALRTHPMHQPSLP